MKMTVVVKEDFPVLSLRRSTPADEELLQGPERQEDEPVVRRRRMADEVVGIMELDQNMLRRYELAREEWVEVQKLLFETYGEPILGSMPSGSPVNARMRRRKKEITSPSPEWISEDQDRRWGFDR